MNCRQARDLLSPYIDGELPSAERAQLEEHLQECGACARELAELETLVEACGSLEMEPLPADFQTRLHRRLVRRHWQPSWLVGLGQALFLLRAPWPGQRRLGWAQVVAAVCLVVFLTTSTLGIAGLAGDWWGMKAEVPGDGGTGKLVSSFTSPDHWGQGAAANRGVQPQVLTGGEVASSDGLAGVGGRGTLLSSAIVPDMYAGEYTGVGASASGGQLAGEKVARSGEMELTVSNLDEAMARLTKMAEAAKGYVQDSTVSVADGKRQAVVVVRVPVDSLAGLMSSLRSLGRFGGQKVTTRDLSQDWVDIDARLRIMDAQKKALGDLLAKAQNIDEILRVQYELYRLQGDIESLQARLQYLQEDMQMASLQLSLKEVDLAAQSNPWRRAQLAFVGTVRTMERLGQEAVVYVAQAFPVVFLAGLAWFVYARFGRGRGQR